MSPRKRKRELSEELREKLLELAGIVVRKNEVSESQNANGVTHAGDEKQESVVFNPNVDLKKVKIDTSKSASELFREAIALKHMGNKVTGASKHLIYVRAGLKFLDHAAASDASKQSNYFRSAGEFLKQLAAHAESATKAPKFIKGDLEHLVLLNYRLSSISFMRSFSIRSIKLTQVKNLLAGKMAKKGTYARDLEGDMNYLVRELDDVLMALHLWRKADDYLAEINEEGNPKLLNRIALMPPLNLYQDNTQIRPLVAVIRQALNSIY